MFDTSAKRGRAMKKNRKPRNINTSIILKYFFVKYAI